MTFDWFTLAAQLFNFVLLLVLLRVLLFKPLLTVMEERDELAAKPLREAREERAAAQAERAAVAQERADFEKERSERREAVLLEVERLREAALAAVEREAASLRHATTVAVTDEVESVVARLRGRLAELVIEELRATLTWVADADLEEQAAKRLEQRLLALDEDQRRALTAAAGSGAVLRSARALEPGIEERLARTVKKLTGAAEVRFEVAEELLLGAVLEVGGMSIDGSVAARLSALEKTFAEELASFGKGAAA